LRGQAQLIALTLMVAVVLAMSLGLISIFNYHYSKLASERAKVASLSRLPAAVTVIPLYSESVEGGVWCHMVEVANIGTAQVTVWVAFAVGYVDETGYPRLDPSYDILRVTQVRVADGLLKMPQCPGEVPGFDVTGQTIRASSMYTVDGWRLDELGNPRDYTLKGFTRVTLKPGDSKTFYVVAEAGAGIWTLAFIVSYINERPVIVSLYKLPS